MLAPRHAFAVLSAAGLGSLGCSTDEPSGTGTATETGTGTGGGSGSGGQEPSCDTAAPSGEEGSWDSPFTFPPSVPSEAQYLMDTEDANHAGQDILRDAVTEGGADPSMLPVHVSHVVEQNQDGTYDGKVLAWWGLGDEYVYDIATGAVSYHPLMYPQTPAPSDIEDVTTRDVFPNVFCAGHTQQEDGSIFVAGGNVTGSFSGGGLTLTAIFTPGDASAWNEGWEYLSGQMTLDRWYPTVKTLADGRKIALGGYNLLNQSFDPYDRIEIYDPAMDSWDSSTATYFPLEDTSMLYPLLFVLPDERVFYAGSEQTSVVGNSNTAAGYDGRIFDPVSEQWESEVITSSPSNSWVKGGAAVEYAPGKILRSGGGNEPREGSQIVDFTNEGNIAWEPTLGSPAWARHLHSMTILPDGRVLVTGGNVFGINNGSPDNDCEVPASLDDDVCSGGNPPGCCATSECLYMEISCSENTHCPPQVGACDEGECVDNASVTCTVDADCPGMCIDHLGVCDPRNAECGAVYPAEVWDPDTECWTTLASMSVPRMYHSTALLLPDTSILVMGGGANGGNANQTTAQVFHPYYGNGPTPTILEINDPDDGDRIAYGDPISILIPPTSPVSAQDIAKVTVVRLGSETHQNDMSQRFMCLGGCGEAGREVIASDQAVQVQAPPSFGYAPAGYYMLFLISSDGVPSLGRYVYIGEDTPSGAAPSSWRCETTSSFLASVSVCAGEPTSGACDSGDLSTIDLGAPTVASEWGGGSSYDGWVVHLPPGVVADVQSPTSDELEIVEARCVDACEQQWQNRAEVSPNCSAAGVFEAPTFISDTSHPAVLAIDESQRDGSGLFTGQSLACDLQSTCCLAFDELTCAAAPERSSPAELQLERHQEYVFALDQADSKLEVSANGTDDDVKLYGDVGFALCEEGNASAACPFYLGSLSAKSIGVITVPIQCPNGSTIHRTLYNLDVRLAQPAIGISETGTDNVGFPAGSLILEVTFKMNAQDIYARGPSQVDVIGQASASSLQFDDIPVTGLAPACWGQDDIPVLGTFSLQMDLVAGALASPPAVAITTPSSVSCPTSVSLTATVTDPDSDLDEQRWYVDDVLLSSSVTTLPVTESHTLRLVATDDRGAATTAKKTIACQ